MKIRRGFVSNSSSSSFVVFKDSLTNKQQDMILRYQEWIDFFISIDDSVKELLEYYKTDPWIVIEYDEFIFCETSMDNFSMEDYLNYIKIDKDIINWDDGWNDKPTTSQTKFISEMRQKYRKIKLDKINENKEI